MPALCESRWRMRISSAFGNRSYQAVSPSHFEAGSSRDSVPSSTSNIVSAATNDLPVLPPGMPTVSLRGMPASTSASPTAARTIRPSARRTAARSPGMSISARASSSRATSACSTMPEALPHHATAAITSHLFMPMIRICAHHLGNRLWSLPHARAKVRKLARVVEQPELATGSCKAQGRGPEECSMETPRRQSISPASSSKDAEDRCDTVSTTTIHPTPHAHARP